jgi:hypothetical protein
MMKSNNTFFDVSRRTTLSALTALPALPLLLPVTAMTQTAASDPLASWNDTATKKGYHGVRGARYQTRFA